MASKLWTWYSRKFRCFQIHFWAHWKGGLPAPAHFHFRSCWSFIKFVCTWTWPTKQERYISRPSTRIQTFFGLTFGTWFWDNHENMHPLISRNLLCVCVLAGSGQLPPSPTPQKWPGAGESFYSGQLNPVFGTKSLSNPIPNLVLWC